MGSSNTTVINPQTKEFVPNQLPPRVTHFVGRVPELETLHELLKPGQVVSIIGPPGIGKSALASAYLWESGDGLQARFPDGVVYYNQVPDISNCLAHIATSFGVDVKTSEHSAAAQALSGRTALLVIESTEQFEDIAPLLSIRGSSTILLTSRVRRDIIQEYIDIDALADRESIALLQALGGSWVADQEATYAIVNFLNGWPFAINLVGHFLVQQRQSATTYWQWLQKQPFTALDQETFGVGSVPTVLAHTLACVDKTARNIMAVAGQLQQSPFTVDLMRAVLDQPHDVIQSAFYQLVNYGLLENADDLYEVQHSLIHLYTHRRLDLEGSIDEQLYAYFTTVGGGGGMHLNS